MKWCLDNGNECQYELISHLTGFRKYIYSNQYNCKEVLTTYINEYESVLILTTKGWQQLNQTNYSTIIIYKIIMIYTTIYTLLKNIMSLENVT